MPIAQVEVLINVYKIDDNSKKVIICSKLKAKALRWFHSKVEHIQMDVENLL